jgi:hypothetical protein
MGAGGEDFSATLRDANKHEKPLRRNVLRADRQTRVAAIEVNLHEKFVERERY